MILPITTGNRLALKKLPHETSLAMMIPYVIASTFSPDKTMHALQIWGMQVAVYIMTGMLARNAQCLLQAPASLGAAKSIVVLLHHAQYNPELGLNASVHQCWEHPHRQSRTAIME